ncbi:hypothetical protein GQ602_003891 [Ophiocordyceps camponoti-floridani]|uniref:Uncharacterized protein n=1 Tax=Ophiocordyceps camponoti-floridani TaxID=2030778 RepID=A0A8H4VD82_9HYPO|nr:hypothetical protein GQ602_003891 [Ophiocordyceps camponoti-floridani]
MVSFFGIKFKEGKRAQKIQSKAPSGLKAEKPALDQSQQSACNFSRPQTAAARSVTSHSRRGPPPPPAWCAVFGSAAASSSSAELQPPSLGGLRRNASDLNLNIQASRAAQSPSPSTPSIVGTPTRSLSRKAQWVNPLDVHFCRDSTKLEKKAQSADVGHDGCPSPPNSDRNKSYVAYHPSVGRVSPDSNFDSGRFNGRTAASLPSPAPSSPVTSDVGELPLLQGNFADFDFGDVVSKPAVSPQRPVTPTSDPCPLPQLDTPKASAPASTLFDTPRAAPPVLTLFDTPRPAPSVADFDTPKAGAPDMAGETPPAAKFETPRAAPPPQTFSLRVDSMANSRRAQPPQPPTTSAGVKLPETPSRHADVPRQPAQSPSTSPSSSSLRPTEFDSPALKSLPRGRQLEPAALTASVDAQTETDEGTEAHGRTGVMKHAETLTQRGALEKAEMPGEVEDFQETESHKDEMSWPTFNKVDVRRSAVPPPLSTSSSRSPSGSGPSSAEDSASEQLMESPDFVALATTFTGDDLVKSFELALEESLGGGLFSVIGDMNGLGAGLGKTSCDGLEGGVESGYM